MRWAISWLMGRELPEMSEYSILYSADSPYDFYNTKKSRNNRVYPGSGKDPYVDVARLGLLFRLDCRMTAKRNQSSMMRSLLGFMMDDWSKVRHRHMVSSWILLR